MTDLPDDIEALKALIKQLLEKNVQLEAENAALRRRLAMDSRKPPSSDGLKKKIIQRGLSKHKNKKNGGQPGHKANTLKRVTNPEQVKVYLPQHCGTRLLAAVFQLYSSTPCAVRGAFAARTSRFVGKRPVVGGRYARLSAGGV